MPLALTTFVIGLTGRMSSIVDSRDMAPPAGVNLELPAAYIATSPVSRTLDALSLFSISQAIWFFIVIALGVLARVAATRSPGQRSLKLRMLRALAVLVAVVAVVEGIVVLAPRAMAGLSVNDPDVVTVDFHSHTKASHDTYQRFTAERNREWHMSGGFDLAYLTDHVKWGGVTAARPRNPVRAGEGTSLLSAVEGHYHRVSTVMLALREADRSILNGWGELQPGSPSIGRPPVTIVALPGNLDSAAAAISDTFPRFTGIELVDAAPRGLGQLDREEGRIREIAANARLLLVSASNNHGWGRTVAAWNLIRIPGWRGLAPDSVGRLIEEPFRDRDLDAVTIVKRRRPRTHGVTTPLTLPVAAYQVMATLTMAERGVWLAWIWGATLIVLLARHVRPVQAATTRSS